MSCRLLRAAFTVQRRTDRSRQARRFPFGRPRVKAKTWDFALRLGLLVVEESRLVGCRNSGKSVNIMR